MERTLRTIRSKNDVNPGDLQQAYNQLLGKLNTAVHDLALHAERINELTNLAKKLLENEQRMIDAIARSEIHLFAMIRQAIRGGMEFKDLQQDMQDLTLAENLEQYWGIASSEDAMGLQPVTEPGAVTTEQIDTVATPSYDASTEASNQDIVDAPFVIEVPSTPIGVVEGLEQVNTERTQLRRFGTRKVD